MLGGKRTIGRFYKEIRKKKLFRNYSGIQPRLWERRVPPKNCPRGFFLAISWHPELAANCLLELVSCRDELQAYALNSLVLARILLLLLRL